MLSSSSWTSACPVWLVPKTGAEEVLGPCNGPEVCSSLLCDTQITCSNRARLFSALFHQSMRPWLQQREQSPRRLLMDCLDVLLDKVCDAQTQHFSQQEWKRNLRRRREKGDAGKEQKACILFT